jgi:hypothetical protein
MQTAQLSGRICAVAADGMDAVATGVESAAKIKTR